MSNVIITQDVINPHLLQSSVSAADCYVCGRGIADGYRITAKTLPSGTILLCDIHESRQ